MSPLQSAVVAALSEGGALATADPAHTERQEQLEMGLAVAAAIDARSALVVEAGTGVGKTYAYLVPALLSGARTLLSTATKTLQDQLFLRDLPRLRAALGVPVTVALLKGRSSYLCAHRLGLARTEATLPDRFAVRALARIEAWAQTTTGGDLAELEGLDERSAIIPLVTSSRENCLGSECPQAKSCHVNKARREAMVADLVVVNHHLFFADVSLRDSGVAELLPSVDVAVFDEAHQLGEAGVQFLGTVLGSSQLIDFARDMLAVGLQQARGLLPWPDLASACDKSARDLRLAACGRLAESRASLKLRWSERGDDAAFVDALRAVESTCRTAREGLDTVSEL
ncbi:MAG TPA: ATP-dependent DNA helicase, partial [Caldimonas sp.]|nr:ATP-dependent DNA helicase [Caldimonas sp.]